jgi:hypothetical protein
MPHFSITSDGTVEGTKVTKDGVELTEKNKVVAVNFNANATWEELSVSYVIEEDYIDEDGNKNGVQRVSYVWNTNEWIRSEQNEEAPKVSNPSLGKSTDETEGQIGGKEIKDISNKDHLKRIFSKGDNNA